MTVENHTGAGATAGPAQVARYGYTLLINTSAQAYSAAFLKNLPYDPLKDFIPVAPLTSQPCVLVAGKPAGVTTISELIAAAKAKPRELKFGSTGPGTIEGRTTYVIAPISITLPQIRDGKLVPLGVTTARRYSLLPEVPTIAEAGVAGFDFPIWYGVWVSVFHREVLR